MRGYYLDVRTKITLLLVSNLLILIHLPLFYETVVLVFLTSLLVLERQWYRMIVYPLIFLTLVCLESFMVEQAVDFGYIAMFIVGCRRFLPCFILSGMIMRSSLHAFIVTMRSWHIPESVVLAVAVMLRFLPMLRIRYREIRQALQTRGLFLTVWAPFCHPIAFIERVTLPMLLLTTQTAQELTIASLTKGIGKKHKTSYQEYRLGWLDYMSLFVFCTLTLVCLVGVAND